MIILEAVSKAMAVHVDAWESETCPACGSDKWKHYPFCRHCSIRLQRAGLMGTFPGCGAPARVIMRTKFFVRWTRYYDLCRDYLIVTRRDTHVASGDTHVAGKRQECRRNKEEQDLFNKTIDQDLYRANPLLPA